MSLARSLAPPTSTALRLECCAACRHSRAQLAIRMNRATAHPHPLLVPAIAASQFAPPFMISGVAVALPALGTDLAAGATALSLVETVFLAAGVALLLPAGRPGGAPHQGVAPNRGQ